MEKPSYASVTFLGLWQHGVSTLAGHLLFQAGSYSQRTIDKYKTESALIGMPSCYYAWITDYLKTEREIRSTRALRSNQMITPTRRFTVHVVPTTPTYEKMLLCGAALSDFVVLVVSGAVDPKVIVQKFSNPVPIGNWRWREPALAPLEMNVSQLKEQLLICQGVGVKRLIVAVSQLDKLPQPYSEESFNRICKEAIWPTLKATGFNIDEVPIVPVSGFQGENLTKPSEFMNWYKGKPLLQTLESLPTPLYPFDLPLRMVVLDRYRISGIGTVVVGRIESGVMTAGETAIRQLTYLKPKPVEIQCRSIEQHHEIREAAKPGEYVGVNFVSMRKYDFARGDILYCPKDQAEPPQFAKTIKAKIRIFNEVGAITAGKATFSICCGLQTAGVRLEAIESIDGKQVPEGGKHEKLVQGDMAVVSLTVLSTAKRISVEKYAEFGNPGRILLRSQHQTVAIGIVQDFVPIK